MSHDETWRARALCHGMDPDEADAIFYPHRDSNAKEGKEICGACPVAAECLTYALETRQAFGVWGRMTERERAKLLKKNHGPNWRTPKRPNLPTADERCGTTRGVGAHRRRNEQLCDDCRAARIRYETPTRQARRAAQREDVA